MSNFSGGHDNMFSMSEPGSDNLPIHLDRHLFFLGLAKMAAECPDLSKRLCEYSVIPKFFRQHFDFQIAGVELMTEASC